MAKSWFLFFYCICVACLDTLKLHAAEGPTIPPIHQFYRIPFAEKEGIVLHVSKLKIPGYPFAYNPSIVKHSKETYLIAFRHDFPMQYDGYRAVKLGLIETDLHFFPLTEPKLLDTGNTHSPDPRLFRMDNKFFISYAHLTKWGPPYECCIGLSTIDPLHRTTKCNYDLLYKKGPREKNWVPFVHTSTAGKSDIYFVYSFMPYTLVRLKQPISGAIDHPFPPSETAPQGLLQWEARYGKIRGGTPAEIVGDEYLCFFHSSFQEKSLYWYVFGAITFDTKPPFSIRRISSHPILFQKMYSSSFAAQRNLSIRAIFPSGFVQAEEHNKDVLHVLCGENDSAIKVITFDTKKLLSSLRPI